LSRAGHSRNRSFLSPDVPEHSKYHNTEEQEVQAGADSSKNDKGILDQVKEKMNIKEYKSQRKYPEKQNDKGKGKISI